jgi:hypothetical protein
VAEKFEVVVDTREKIESTNFALLWFFSKVSTSVFGFGKRRDSFSISESVFCTCGYRKIFVLGQPKSGILSV